MSTASTPSTSDTARRTAVGRPSAATPVATAIRRPLRTAADEPAHGASRAGEADEPESGVLALALGVLGRMWLWFLGGVLVVTLLPLLFGWRPYVVQSASMAPAIRAGDVVLSSPTDDPDLMLGRVVVFDSPSRLDEVITHRVVGVNEDGTLVTRGDNNQSADSEPFDPGEVRGLGRLLVRGAGLPLLWLRDGAWLQLLLLAASIWIAAVAVVRDREDEELEILALEHAASGGGAPWGSTAGIRSVGEIPRAPVGADDRSTDLVRSLPRSRRPNRPDRDDGHDDHDHRDHDGHRDDGHDDDGHDDDGPGDSGRRAVQLDPDVADGVTPGTGGDRGAASTRHRTLRGFFGALLVGAVLLAAPTFAAGAFTSTSRNATNAWSVAAVDYATEVLARAPSLYWRLDDTNGNAADDSSGNGNVGRYDPNPATGAFTRLDDGALLSSTPDRAVQVNETGACITTRSNTPITGPQVFAIVAWFRAPSSYTNGGKLIGFERPQSDTAAPPTGTYDRQLYVDGSGRVWFGVDNGGRVALSSAAALNDGNWHLAVGAQDASGMRLYIDGTRVGSNGNTIAATTTGWWRVGCGNLAGWGGHWTGPNNPGTGTATPQNRPFLGSLDEITVYSGVSLSDADVAALWFAR
jgi:signal peptidase I